MAHEKVRRYSDHPYWGKPVPGFGDPNARLAILGLAPAAHGANRTGRMFTGDRSGDWLYHALYECGLANQAESSHAEDGMQLNDVYITATVHCAPPANKPKPEELKQCQKWWYRELELLSNLRIVLCLGRLAFGAMARTEGVKANAFGHHRLFLETHSGVMIMSAYHPSQQNTFTGRLKWPEWRAVFQEIQTLLSAPKKPA